jgi:hypothetical protein
LVPCRKRADPPRPLFYSNSQMTDTDPLVHLDSARLTLQERIGEGAEGVVFKADLRTPVLGLGDVVIPVVVKVRKLQVR